jgi:hypothetical protein
MERPVLCFGRTFAVPCAYWTVMGAARTRPHWVSVS